MHVSTKPFNMAYAIRKCPPALEAHPRWWGWTLKPCPTVPNASPNNWKLTISVIIAPNTAPKVCLETELTSTDSAIILWSTSEVFDTEKTVYFNLCNNAWTVWDKSLQLLFNLSLQTSLSTCCQPASCCSVCSVVNVLYFTGFHTWFVPGLPT